jgi:uncharacterized protein
MIRKDLRSACMAIPAPARAPQVMLSARPDVVGCDGVTPAPRAYLTYKPCALLLARVHGIKGEPTGANADAVRKVYDAFRAGDVASVLGAMDDKIDWQEPTGMPFESQVGPQAVAENIFGPITTQVEDFSFTPDEIIDGGDIVVSVGRYGGKGAASSVDLNTEYAHVWRFGPDGKITGFRTYTDTYRWRQALGVD